MKKEKQAPKVKVLTDKQVRNKLWEECKRIIRLRYQRSDGLWNCFTCGRLVDEPSKAQTGHFIPSSIGGASLRYNLDNLRIQCYNCNINLGGYGAAYTIALKKEKGQKHIDKLFQLKNQSIKASDHFRILLEQYKKVVS